jgi:hypothetical protein
MISRLRSLLIVFAFIASIFFIHPATTQIQTTTFAYCYSDVGSSPVYFTNVFDLGVVVQDTNPLQHEFSEYLRGRFDVKNFPAGCPIDFTQQRAEAGKRNFENQLRQTNKEIIEIDWLYTIDRSLAAPPGQHRITSVVSQLPSDHTFCFSETYADTIYVTGPELSGTSVNLSSWNIGFTQYLKQRYSVAAKVNCEVATRPAAMRLVSAHEQGARAANKTIVNTGWRLDPNTVATAPQQDEDREPPPTSRPAAPQASQTDLQQARAAATTERPASAGYCRNDPILSAVFSCADFSQAVFAYRVAHRADSGAKEPVGRLLDDENFQCTGCVNGVQVMTYVQRRARAENVDPKAVHCVVATLTKTLNQNIHHMRELDRFYKESVAQCNQ